jgi:hypothetical protein
MSGVLTLHHVAYRIVQAIHSARHELCVTASNTLWSTTAVVSCVVRGGGRSMNDFLLDSRNIPSKTLLPITGPVSSLISKHPEISSAHPLSFISFLT